MITRMMFRAEVIVWRKIMYEDYEDEEADSELESKLENASLEQRWIETRENRRAGRPTIRIRGTDQSQLTHVTRQGSQKWESMFIVHATDVLGPSHTVMPGMQGFRTNIHFFLNFSTLYLVFFLSQMIYYYHKPICTNNILLKDSNPRESCIFSIQIFIPYDLQNNYTFWIEVNRNIFFLKRLKNKFLTEIHFCERHIYWSNAYLLEHGKVLYHQLVQSSGRHYHNCGHGPIY